MRITPIVQTEPQSTVAADTTLYPLIRNHSDWEYWNGKRPAGTAIGRSKGLIVGVNDDFRDYSLLWEGANALTTSVDF